MGYYTDFEVSVVSGYDKLGAPLHEILSNGTDYVEWPRSCSMNAKWYSSDNDMVEISKKYPDIVFELSGIGEEHDDIWKQYFKNGKIQMCRAIITFAPYDESQLK